MNAKTTVEKLAAAKKALAEKAAAHVKAKAKVEKLAGLVARESHEKQTATLTALGVSDAATFAALLDAAKRGGFKSPASAPVPSVIPVKPSATASTSSASVPAKPAALAR